jgi:succinyl-CoA synthetase alpha subunit
MINPGARCRIGFMPHPTFLPGSIGIVGKSGTLSYEAVGSTTRAGLGQSLVIGMGGDALAGTTQVDAVKTFMEDPETEGIVMIGEIGGSAELEVADVVREYKANGGKKPIMGLIGGHCAVPGRVMGHAGASRAVGDPSVMDKVRALEAAGMVIVDHPGMFGEGMAKLLGRPVPREAVQGMGPGGLQQKRGLHTMMRRRPASTLPSPSQQTRKLHIKDSANAQKVLKIVCFHRIVYS